MSKSNKTTASNTVNVDRFFSVAFSDINGESYEVVLSPDEAATLRDFLDQALNTTGP